MLSAGLRTILLSGYCPEARAFFARASGLDTKHKRLYDDLLGGSVADGVFPKLDALYTWSAPTQATGLLNLKSASFPCVVNGTPSFAADRGFTGDGSTFFLDTGMNPSTAGGNYSQDGMSIGAYNLTSRAATSNKFNLGADNGAAFTQISSLNLFDTNGSGAVRIRANCLTETTSAAPATSQGSFGVGRTGAAAGSLCRNGAQVATFATASVGMPDRSFYFFAFHLNASAFGHVADEMSAGFIGGGLTSTELNMLSNRINTFMAGLPVPINVY